MKYSLNYRTILQGYILLEFPKYIQLVGVKKISHQIINRPVSVTSKRRLLAPAVGVLVAVAVGARVGPLIAAVTTTGLVAARVAATVLGSTVDTHANVRSQAKLISTHHLT